jgi:hypothetical protein
MRRKPPFSTATTAILCLRRLQMPGGCGLVLRSATCSAGKLPTKAVALFCFYPPAFSLTMATRTGCLSVRNVGLGVGSATSPGTLFCAGATSRCRVGDFATQTRSPPALGV